LFVERFAVKRLSAAAVLLSLVPAVGRTTPVVMVIETVQADRDGVTIRAPVQGPGACTPTRKNLTVAISKDSGLVTLLVAPRGAAECRDKGSPAEVHWSYEELGVAPGEGFTIANPLARPR